jgi:hypothetical protein
MTLSTAMRPPPASECGWSGCGHLAPVEVFITVPGTRPRAGSVGCYCVGHAVITGVEAQTLHHGRVWYLPALHLTDDTQATSN